MKKSIVWGLLALAFGAQNGFAAAITVKESEVANKVCEITLQEVSLKSGRAVILADAKGISVYTFDLDKEGVSNCKGNCLKEWPPLHVATDEVLPAPFGRIKGNDGQPQLTVKGLPLYYYDDDRAPGDVFGDYPKWHPVTTTK